jgi:hypothetical protein
MANLIFRPIGARFFTDGCGIIWNTVGKRIFPHQTMAGV